MSEEKQYPGVYVAEGARIVGNVKIGEGSSVWYNAVIRGDSAEVVIGERTNVQDLACIHEDTGNPALIGDDVTIGHGAIVHGCVVEGNTIIGMGAIILNGARIGRNCIIGAGSLVTQNKVIPEGSMVYGNPAKVIRPLTPGEIEHIRENAEHYVRIVRESGALTR